MEITANSVQTVAVNQNVLFTDVAVPGCPAIMHRDGSGLVTLRGLTSQSRARFRLSFGGNIAVSTGQAAGPISLEISINGEGVDTTKMISTPAAAGDFQNVSSSIFVDVPKCCCLTVSVENTSTIPVDVQNANFIIERVA